MFYLTGQALESEIKLIIACLGDVDIQSVYKELDENFEGHFDQQEARDIIIREV